MEAPSEFLRVVVGAREAEYRAYAEHFIYKYTHGLTTFEEFVVQLNVLYTQVSEFYTGLDEEDV
jgi:hypothetical protein